MIFNKNKPFFFWKGRVALYAILKAMGIKPGDEIILPGFTCVVVPNAIIYLGAKPVYVDIDAGTYNIDPEKIEERITAKTRVIIAQHTFGIPADMEKIIDVAKRYNIYVIEDSCHTISSKYKGKEVGTFGDASFFSSQWSKPVTTGLGGWAVINNEQLLERMQRVYSEFIVPSLKENKILRLQYYIYSMIFKPSLFWPVQNTYRKLSGLGLAIGSSSKEELECEKPQEYEKKMSLWQQKLLGEKLMKAARDIDHRKWITSLYENHLKEKKMETINLAYDCEPVILRYPFIVEDKSRALSEAQKRKIEIGDWFLSPIHPNLGGWGSAGYKKGMCPIAEKICKHIINLPTHHGIESAEVGKIIDFIANI